MFIFERPTLDMVMDCAVPLLYSGACSCGIAYTLQPVGQRYADPSTASIVMSLESVFALISGMIILHETISPVELLGCLLMFGAIILNTVKS